MKLLQVTLWFALLMMLAHVSAYDLMSRSDEQQYLDVNWRLAEPPKHIFVLTSLGWHYEPQLKDDFCYSNVDCYNERLNCFCIGKKLDLPGQCKCIGLRTEP